MRVRLLCIAMLALAVLASAVATVRVQHERRALFVELQRLERERDALRVHWGRLRLEHSKWSTHERVERIANEALDLVPPPQEAVVLVTPRERGASCTSPSWSPQRARTDARRPDLERREAERREAERRQVERRQVERRGARAV